MFGKWLDLEDYADKDAFLEACAELHADESDPELMFQDREDVPEGMVSESHVDESVWEWLDLDESDRELLAVYRSEMQSDGDIDDARESFAGKYDSEAEWATQCWDDSGMLAEIPAHAQNYIDYESYARDARLGGDMCFVRHNGDVWAFRNI